MQQGPAIAEITWSIPPWFGVVSEAGGLHMVSVLTAPRLHPRTFSARPCQFHIRPIGLAMCAVSGTHSWLHPEARWPRSDRPAGRTEGRRDPVGPPMLSPNPQERPDLRWARGGREVRTVPQRSAPGSRRQRAGGGCRSWSWSRRVRADPCRDFGGESAHRILRRSGDEDDGLVVAAHLSGQTSPQHTPASAPSGPQAGRGATGAGYSGNPPAPSRCRRLDIARP